MSWCSVPCWLWPQVRRAARATVLRDYRRCASRFFGTNSRARAALRRLQPLPILAALLLAPPVASAQSAADAYPSKPIRLVVNFAPGGMVDTIGRILAQKLSESFTQPVVVENRAGASGNIGAAAVAKSEPDGYTVLMTNGETLTTNPHLFRNMTFDPLRDFAPIIEVTVNAPLLLVKLTLPVNSAPEFLAYLRSNPGKLSYGSAGNGSMPHLLTEILKRQANVSATHIPYKGLGPALADLLAGQIDFMFDAGGSIPQIRSGKVKLLAVASEARRASFPQTPTLIESGVPGFHYGSPHALVAPAGTPKDIIARLNHEVGKILRTPEFNERIRATGTEVVGNTPEEFAANLRAEYQRIGRFIQEMGIRGD